MPRLTIKELQEKLEIAENTIEKLKSELEFTRAQLKTREEVYTDEIKYLKDTIESNNFDINIKNKLLGIGIRAEHNSRGAGRKEFQDYDTVKRIYDLYKNSESLQDIANILNKENIRTKSGGTWSKSSVRFILLNHTYVTKGVIDEEMFNLIGKYMKGTRKDKLMTEEEYNRKPTTI